MFDVNKAQLSNEQLRAAELIERISEGALDYLGDGFQFEDIAAITPLAEDVVELINMFRDRAHDPDARINLLTGAAVGIHNNNFPLSTLDEEA